MSLLQAKRMKASLLSHAILEGVAFSLSNVRVVVALWSNGVLASSTTRHSSPVSSIIPTWKVFAVAGDSGSANCSMTFQLTSTVRSMGA